MENQVTDTTTIDEKASRPADKDNAEALDTLAPEPEQNKAAPSDKSGAKRPADKDVKLEGEEIVIDDSAEAAVVQEQEAPALEISEDINGLLESLELPEEFKAKAITVFEAAVTGQVKDLHKQMLESNAAAMEVYKTSLQAKLQEQVDTYLANTVAKWLEENQVAVKSNLRVQLAESFMANLLDLLEKHYITVPEGKEDVLETALEKLAKAETALAEEVEANAKLRKESVETSKKATFVIETASLTDVEKARVAELAESIDGDTSVEVYKEKLSVIIESLSSISAEKSSTSLTEDINGEVSGVEDETQTEVITESEVDPEVAFYVSSIKQNNLY